MPDDRVDLAGTQFPVLRQRIDEEEVLRFAYATRDPVLAGAGGASGAPGAAPAVPPMFYLVLRTRYYMLARREELRDDGTAGREALPLPYSRSMAGETHVSFPGEMVVGQEVLLRRSIAGVEEKTGRSGPLTLVHYDFDVGSTTGERLVHERYVRVLR